MVDGVSSTPRHGARMTKEGLEWHDFIFAMILIVFCSIVIIIIATISLQDHQDLQRGSEWCTAHGFEAWSPDSCSLGLHCTENLAGVKNCTRSLYTIPTKEGSAVVS